MAGTDQPEQPRRYNVAEFAEAIAAKDSVILDLPDGSTITVPPPLLWPQEAFDALFGRSDLAASTRSMLGDEQYERLLANGYTWRIVDAILKDAQGATVGESPASSST